MGFHACKQGECAIVQLHHHALQGFLSFFVGDFKQLQDHGLIFAQHFPGGDAEQQCVSNLTSGSCDGDANGLFAHGVNSRW